MRSAQGQGLLTGPIMEDLSLSPMSSETEGVCIHPLKVTKFETCVWKYILRDA